jgi:hypothetical protein
MQLACQVVGLQYCQTFLCCIADNTVTTAVQLWYLQICTAEMPLILQQLLQYYANSAKCKVHTSQLIYG